MVLFLVTPSQEGFFFFFPLGFCSLILMLCIFSLEMLSWTVQLWLHVRLVLFSIAEILNTLLLHPSPLQWQSWACLQGSQSGLCTDGALAKTLVAGSWSDLVLTLPGEMNGGLRAPPRHCRAADNRKKIDTQKVAVRMCLDAGGLGYR